MLFSAAYPTLSSLLPELRSSELLNSGDPQRGNAQLRTNERSPTFSDEQTPKVRLLHELLFCCNAERVL